MAKDRSKLARWVFAIGICTSVLAIGSLDARVLCLVAATIAVGSVVIWADGEIVPVRRSASVLVFTAVALVAATLVQIVPIPIAWAASLSPHAAEIWRGSMTPFHAPIDGLVTLSLDSPQTKIEVLRGILYLSAFLLALRIAYHRNGSVFIERTILVSVTIIAVAAVVHHAVDAHRVFGIYEPRNRDVTIIAPLLNINQLSGYLTIGVCISFASLLSPTPIAPRSLLVGLVLVLVSGIVWLASRGAVASLGLGMVLVIALTVASRREGARGLTFVAPTLVGAAGIAMMAFSASPIAKQELTDTDVSKLHVQWLALRSMSSAYTWFGAGRGAFESTFPEFRTGTGHFVFTHPENVIVQWVSEWGIPIALVGFAGILWSLRPSVLLSRSQPPIGPWCALVALALHNLVDFTSEVPGVMLSLTACAAVVVARGASQESRQWTFERWSRHPRAVAVFVGVSTSLAIILALAGQSHELFGQRLRFQKMSVDPHISNETFFEALKGETLQHPAEPYFAYVGAARTLLFVPNGSVVPWIDRTLERAPVYPTAHVLLARWLRTRNPSQALLEYRLGAEQSGAEIGKEAESLVRSYEDAIELAPPGKRGVAVLDALGAILGSRLPATRWQLDVEILVRDPNAAAPRLRMARDAMLDVTDSPVWCRTSDCISAAIGAARDAQAHSDLCEPHAIEARALLLEGDTEGALTHLDAATNTVADRATCLNILAQMALDANADVRATDAIQHLADCSCSDERDCVQNLLAAASLEERRGHRTQALMFYRRAADQAPERDDLVELVASRASAAGLHSFAADAYQRLSTRDPANARYFKAARDEANAARSLRP